MCSVEKVFSPLKRLNKLNVINVCYINLSYKIPVRHYCKMNEVIEGKAKVFYPKSVFYNPVQEFNRDLTIAVISTFIKNRRAERKGKEKQKKREDSNHTNNQDNYSEKVSTEININEDGKPTSVEELEAGKSYEDGVRILEGLAASGLRSMRFGLEIPGVKEIIANDFDQSAYAIIQKNIEENNLGGIVKANYGDAAMVMYQHRDKKDQFDVIDLDPYGSPHTFLDATVQAVADGGLLCITCTDAAVLCGKCSETCYSKYGSVSLSAPYCHKMALRIILQCLESHANRYSRYTEPLLSVSVDFYFRVFVRVYTGQGKVKRSLSKMAMVYHCTGCGAFHQQKLGLVIPTKGNNVKYSPATGPSVSSKCDQCDHSYHVGGPIWAAPMHDTQFAHQVVQYVQSRPDSFKTASKITGMLTVIGEELSDQPLYWIADNIYGIVHSQPMNFNMFRSAILNAGYRVSISHCKKNSIKTDAPPAVIWDIIKEFIKTKSISERHLKDGTPVKAILSKEQTTKISFEAHPDANPPSREKGLKRFPNNPEKFWGPKPKAKRNMQNEEADGLASKKTKTEESGMKEETP